MEGNKVNAKIFFGSIESVKENISDRVSPYSGEVVSTAPVCNEHDVHKALEIAKAACAEAKKSTLSQRCNWLLDVASKLQENKEDIAQNYY